MASASKEMKMVFIVCVFVMWMDDVKAECFFQHENKIPASCRKGLINGGIVKWINKKRLIDRINGCLPCPQLMEYPVVACN